MHANCKRLISPLVMAAFAFLGVANAKASSVVVGGTGLLTQSGVDQLATWLGEGDLQLTKVFSHTKNDGKTSLNFHTDADGKGRTFTVAEVTSVSVNVGGLITTTNVNLTVGGYNPLSWNSSGTYNINPGNAGRTAFLYNLTSLFTLGQQAFSNTFDPGQYQTLNQNGPSAFAGPTFGAGYDLGIDWTLNAGKAFQYSYGANGTGGQNIVDLTGVSTLTFDKLDVFTIANVAPLPSTALLGVVLLGGIVLLQARRRVAG